jgi:predicted Holliday junction resolvase-like endonuclease
MATCRLGKCILPTIFVLLESFSASMPPRRQHQTVIGNLKERELNMTKRPQLTAKAVNIGFILERIAPAFDHFPFEHNDCRSLFDPIDYIIFEGLNKSGVVNKIIFTDIKTGAARLKNNQKEIKTLIDNKKVEFKIY